MLYVSEVKTLIKDNLFAYLIYDITISTHYVIISSRKLLVTMVVMYLFVSLTTI